MDPETKKYLRIQNCIETMRDVQRRIGRSLGDQCLSPEFRSLEERIRGLDMRGVSEGDILLVERATNALMGELRAIFASRRLGPVYSTLPH